MARSRSESAIPRLAPKKLRFAQILPAGIAAGETQEQIAIKAGYSPASARTSASLNMRKPEVLAPLLRIQDAATSKDVLSLLKRKERLSRLALNNHDTDPVRAIAELNRMERVYGEETSGGDTYNQIILQGYTIEQLETMLKEVRARERLAAGDRRVVGPGASRRRDPA